MDLRKIIKEARAQGWRVDYTSKGHVRFWPPDPDHSPVIGAGTPSDHRSIRNMLSQLKKRGFRWPPK